MVKTFLTTILLFRRLFSQLLITPAALERMPFYAVRKGRKPGIYATWSECQEQINKFPGARYKKFATNELAQEFVNGSDNPAEAALSNGDWVGSCKQKLTEMASKFAQAVPELNKYLSTLPENLKTNDALIAGFTEAKADVIMCKDTIGSILKLLDGDQPVAGTSKRKSEDDNTDVKRMKSSSSDGDVPVVYTDGACFNNGASNAQAGIGVWWGANDKRNISERLRGRQSNNRAEIYAACKAAQQAIDLGFKRLEIRTDSQFMINCMTMWIEDWKINNWRLKGGGPVKNEKELKELDALCSKVDITWTHVKGHCGIAGNEQADRLANAGARRSAT